MYIDDIIRGSTLNVETTNGSVGVNSEDNIIITKTGKLKKNSASRFMGRY